MEKKQDVHILVVDDEAGLLEVITDFFHYKGYRVTLAPNGPRGIECVKKEKVDLVLLDLVMPGMDGVETLRKMKEINPRLAVVMLTGMADEGLARETIQTGASDFLLKPIDFKQLEMVVMTHLVMREKAA